jgi:chorismate synthase
MNHATPWREDQHMQVFSDPPQGLKSIFRIVLTLILRNQSAVPFKIHYPGKIKPPQQQIALRFAGIKGIVVQLLYPQHLHELFGVTKSKSVEEQSVKVKLKNSEVVPTRLAGFIPEFLSGIIPRMSGNTFGTLFTVTNFGESHGPAIGCVIDGCPPGMALSEADIQHDLDRRRPGTSRHVTQRQEPDQVQILSGVYQGVTTGTPIALLIHNTDQRSKDYSDILQSFRPGHADYTYLQKYGVRDPRGGGRSSARLTAPTVAAGAVAKKWLKEKFGTSFIGCMTQLGEHPIGFEDWAHVPHNPFYAPIQDVSYLENYMDSLRKAGDSCGARIRVVAQGMPVGLGQPIYDRLDADIAYAMMGLNAVKGIEIGAGFASVAQLGSSHGDSLTPEGFANNNAGGILGGISTGQDLEVSIAIKPTSSILTPRDSIDSAGNAVQVQTKGRHDPCVGIRATPIAEALLALVVMDHALRHRAQCADVVPPVTPIAAHRPD